LFDSINQVLVVGEALANARVLENCRLLQEQLEQQEIQIQELINKHDEYKDTITRMAVRQCTGAGSVEDASSVRPAGGSSKRLQEFKGEKFNRDLEKLEQFKNHLENDFCLYAATFLTDKLQVAYAITRLANRALD
jgi:formate dehydrogenase assembly factor FdhD